MKKRLLVATMLLATIVTGCVQQPCYYGDEDRYEYDDD